MFLPSQISGSKTVTLKMKVWRRLNQLGTFIGTEDNIAHVKRDPHWNIAGEFSIQFQTIAQERHLTIRDNKTHLVMTSSNVKLGWRPNHRWPRDIVMKTEAKSNLLFLDVFDENFNLRMIAGNETDFERELFSFKDDKLRELLSKHYGRPQKLAALVNIEGTVELKERQARTMAQLTSQKKVVLVIIDTADKTAFDRWTLLGECMYISLVFF